MRSGMKTSLEGWSRAGLSFALAVAWTLSGCSGSSRGDTHDATIADSSLIDNPVDEEGYSLVGEDVHPALYQRVFVASCTENNPELDECVADGDCGEGFACVCGFHLGTATFNECWPAECRSMADCDGGQCLLSIGGRGDACCDSGAFGLFCSRSASTCQHGGDCPGNGIACIYDDSLDLFECKLHGCSCSM